MDGKKLKILMTTDTIGGVWNYSLQLCRALASHNVKIHLLGLGASPTEYQMQEARKCHNLTFYPTNFKLEWMDNPWDDIAKIEDKIEKLINLVKPDLLHFNNYINCGQCWSIPKITVYHSCVQTWWQAVKGTNVPPEWNRYLDLLEAAVNSSDVVVFPTEELRKMAFKVNRIYANSKVIPNGRDTGATGNIEKENIILCTGRIWDEAKNLMSLCAIADQLPWPIYVAGENAHPETCEKIQLGNVRFLGKLNAQELNFWLERTEIYINPALYEPFGLAVLEAAKAGCALALSNLGTLQEVWSENACYFNPRKEEEFVECILELIENETTRKEYQRKAKTQAEKYSSQVFGDAYYRLYTDLLEKEQKNIRKITPINPPGFQLGNTSERVKV